MLGVRGFRSAIALAGLGSALAAAPALAQYPPGAVVQPLAPAGATEALREHLKTLADNPRSLSALVGAGRAALELGDHQAALTFFGRAEEISPRDARVKAGMGSAFVRLEQPEPALRYFAEAASLGAPEAEIAGDRGLAYDLTGDPRRAQQDYVRAIRHRDTPELRRRLALSLAISGEEEAALRLIDRQLRDNDRAAWRTRALIHALAGDWRAASEAARSTMSPQAAEAMAPFLARLAALGPSQKAMAVHFGHFPSNGQAVAATHDVRAYPQALALAGVSAQRPVQTASNQAAQPRQHSERPPTSFELLRGRARQPRRTQPDPAPRQRVAQAQPQAQPPARPAQTPPVRVASAQPPVPIIRQAPPPPAQPLRTTQPAIGLVDRSQAVPAASGTIAPAQLPPSAPASQAEPGFEEIAALVQSLPAETPPAPRQPTQRPPAQADQPQRAQATQPRPAARTQRPARPAHPSRHWVQIAGGADRGALPREFARLRDAAPDLLRGRTPYVAAARATNRLLVGPFDSVDEAQRFVNRLAGKDIAAFTWTSVAGQEVERLAGVR